MVTKKTIVIEERLAEMFEYLPAMKSAKAVAFKPVFMYGNELQLLDFLRQNSTGKSVYPLIWLLMPFEETHKRSSVDFSDLTLILAVETNKVMLNDQRLKETYKKVLMPLCDNIIHCFKTANISSITNKYTITKYPNYSKSSEANKATYIWDALRISFSGYLNSNCLKPIYFTNK